MPLDFYVLANPYCAIPILLVSLDYLNKSDEFERRKNNVIDFDKFVKFKGQGDAIDSDIAKLLEIDKVAA